MPPKPQMPEAVEAAALIETWLSQTPYSTNPITQTGFLLPEDRQRLVCIIQDKMAPAIERAYREGWQARHTYPHTVQEPTNQNYDWLHSKAYAALAGKEGKK